MVSPQRKKILVVEDELDIQDLICLHLRRDGYQVEAVADGEEALRFLKRDSSFDLLVLDWMLPGLSGLDITKAVRETPALKLVPILMVTARMEATDIILGLEAGADDYVTKPFEIPVLMARVRALLRRAKQLRGTETATAPAGAGKPVVEAWIKMGPLSMNPDAYEVRCGSDEISLTPSEFKLLHALAVNRGRVLTRDKLIDAVQGAGVTVVDRAIDTHVFGLRKKLGACADVIETVRGVGYRVRGEDEAE